MNVRKRTKKGPTTAERRAEAHRDAERVLEQLEDVIEQIDRLSKPAARALMHKLEEASFVACESDAEIVDADGSYIDCTDYSMLSTDAFGGIRLYIHTRLDVDYAGEDGSDDFMSTVESRLLKEKRLRRRSEASP